VIRGLAAFALWLVLSAPRTAGAVPCAPRAELAGDPAVVARVAVELARLGVAIGAASPGCRAVRAQVELDDGGVAVAIAFDTQRSEGRVLSDPALAAAWIDSWLRDELDDGWTQGAAPSRVPAAGAAVDHPSPPERPGPRGAGRSLLAGAELGLDYEQTFTVDGPAWTGFGGHACARLGWLCIGVRARYASQRGLTPEAPTSTRSDVSVLAASSAEVRLGQMSIAAELGAGFGWMKTERKTTCVIDPVVGCDPKTDPSCSSDPAICIDASGAFLPVDGQRTRTYTPRLAAGLSIAVPLFEHVWLDGIASVTYAPFGHVEPFAAPDQGAPSKFDAGKLALPGEPRAMVQLGVGLRVGAP
jgi:hypothetical protein